MQRASVLLCTIGLLLAPAAKAEQAPPHSGLVAPVAELRPLRGTPVQLMVTKEINSRSAKAGERFKLRVNAPVMVDGTTTIPVGAFAWGEVVAVLGTSAAGGRGHLSLRLLYVETPSGQIALSGTQGTEGKSNTEGVVLGVLGFGLLGLLNKGGNALFKAGDLITGYIAEGEAPAVQPLVVG